MVKLIVGQKRLTRHDLANLHSNKSMLERLRAAGAVDLRNNSVTKDLGNGFSETIPLNMNKKF